MDDGGITLTGLTIGGAALTTLGGLLGAYFKARYSRTEIHPQPLSVREDHPPISPELCGERHKTLNEQVKDLYIRINMAEVTIGELKALRDQVKSMDSKIDLILTNVRAIK